MSVVEENWQTSRPTIRERSTFMFNNDLLSDVKFVVRGSNGESESKKVIPAHKFVLSISSPVFQAMFYGELADGADSVDLPDCEYEGLLELFRYMYSDEVKLSGSNVMQVLYLAKKYVVPSLADKCTEYLQKSLDASNAFCILPHALIYEEKDLVDQCWEAIEIATEEAVKSDGFVTIQRSLLEELVEKDALTIEEVELFKAVDLWATKECERQSLQAADGETKRKVLGERVVKGIRFPVMKEKDFVGVVVDCNILTSKEAWNVIKYFNGTLSAPVGFPEAERIGCSRSIKRICRFDSMILKNWTNGTCSLLLSVNKNVILHGVHLFGSKNGNYHSVSCKIQDAGRNSVLASKEGRFSSEDQQFKLWNYSGFDVLFDRPVLLNKGVKYRIEVNMSGLPSSCSGTKGLRSAQHSTVTWTFENTENRPEEFAGTSTRHGQIFGFLFSCK